MSGNGKMVLFFLGATVFNILLMVAFVAVFIIVIGLALGGNPNPTTFQILIFVGFVASIVLTFLLYGKVMKWVTVKFQLEKHIPQLFKNKKK
jgi:hypothetical protein